MASATSTPAARSSSRGRRSARSARSPARMQEKEELRHLNDRLANYIQRVQDLESDKTVMLLQLREQEEATARETAAVRRLYDEELADVRRCLDALAAERARLQIEHGNLQEEFQKLQSRWGRDPGPRPPHVQSKAEPPGSDLRHKRETIVDE